MFVSSPLFWRIFESALGISFGLPQGKACNPADKHVATAFGPHKSGPPDHERARRALQSLYIARYEAPDPCSTSSGWRKWAGNAERRNRVDGDEQRKRAE